MQTCNGLFFVAALVALYIAFWWIGHPVLGILAVAFLGSNPFQLYEVYRNENVFGSMITSATLALALHLPLLGFRRPRRWYTWAVPIATAAVLATMRQLRPEPKLLLLAAAACYLTMGGTRWRTRIALVAVLAVSFLGLSKAWDAWFEMKYQQARKVVVKAGGHPYPGPRELYHMAWHNIWCGLGDFDTKYGYAWNDVAAARYAYPILEKEYGLDLPEWDGQALVYYDAHWDEAGKYYKTPYEMPHYGEVVRDKVLHDITHDPLWYLGILGQRAWRILSRTTPLRLTTRFVQVGLPIHGLVAVPVLLLLVWDRRWAFVKLLCFTFPLSLTPLLVYSDRGTTYAAVYHLIAAALIIAGLVELVLHRRQRTGRRAMPVSSVQSGRSPSRTS
jgi:hypothetical protein